SLPRAFQRLGMYDLVTIGHAARDEFAGDPEWRIGGTAVYAAAAAARFGARAALVTRVGPHERERLADRCARLGITLHALQSEVTTTFAFRYVDGKRQLRLKARAKGIAAEALPADVRETRSVVFASIAHELDRSLFGVFAGAPRVLVAQGYLRTWDADGSRGRVRRGAGARARGRARPRRGGALRERGRVVRGGGRRHRRARRPRACRAAHQCAVAGLTPLRRPGRAAGAPGPSPVRCAARGRPRDAGSPATARSRRRSTRARRRAAPRSG